jgi:hypothetical protein
MGRRRRVALGADDEGDAADRGEQHDGDERAHDRPLKQ